MVKDETDKLDEAMKVLKKLHGKLWDGVVDNNEDLQTEVASNLYYQALDVVKKAIQVAATSKRFIQDVNSLTGEEVPAENKKDDKE
jgi:transcription termination factor NusB